MATNLTNTTFSTTYKDDFRDSDNYYRILFNSGKALQARELTQMQTIIQKEMERFGSHIFKEGGIVQPGGVALVEVEYIKLASGQLPDNTATLLGKTFTVAAPNPEIQVEILSVVPAEGSDPDTLIVRYVSTLDGTSGTTPIRVGNSVTLENTVLGSDYDMTTASTAAAGRGLKFEVEQGVFFAQGHFVFCEKQEIFLSKYSTAVTKDVGFRIIQDVVTVEDTNDLYDNQGAAPNLAAPGADRYRIRLVLTTRDQITSGQNFIFLTRVTDGSITDRTTTDNSYNILNDVLALRTKEESGDYIVKPLSTNFTDLNDSNLQLDVSDGIVYIDGYRLEIASKKITVPKAQDTTTLQNETVVVQYGNYVLGSTNKGLPNISTFERQNIRSATTYGGSTIGTCRVRAVEEDGSNWRYYLFEINMNAGQSFAAAKSIGLSTSSYFDLVLEDGAAQLKNTAQNDLLFPLPKVRPTQTGTTYDEVTVQERYTVTTDGSGNSTSATSVTSGTFEDVGDWIVAPTDDAIESPTITLDGTQTSFTISGASTSKTLEILAKVKKPTPTVRSKTLTDATVTVSWPSAAKTDAAGRSYIDLGKADIYSLDAVKLVDSDGANITDNWTLDNGQRDNYYGLGRVILKSGLTAPTSNIFVRFKHFTHGPGRFFDVTSYNAAQVSYENIPSYRQNDGTTIELRDVVDFRPVASRAAGGIGLGYDSDGAGGTGLINLLPTNTDTFTGDITYYMPRKDRLVATASSVNGQNTQAGKLEVISGTSDLDPKFPPISTSSMPLLDISLNPYTINENDLETTVIENKRFTMADIANLEKRIDDLQELTTLSLLEVNTSSLSVLDSAGNARTKAGFLVDNFKNYDFSAITSNEYRAVNNAANGLVNTLRPEQLRASVGLAYDSADVASTALVKKDLVLLPINSHVTQIVQDLATGYINVNPFNVITKYGTLDLRRSSTSWTENVYLDPEETSRTIRRTVRGQRSGRSVSTSRAEIADRAVGDAYEVAGNARSFKVNFFADELRPNTRHFLYFDGQNISSYAREDSSYDQGLPSLNRVYNKLTTHPDGATQLVSNQYGEIKGSFIVPNNDTLTFSTGTKKVKLLDISVDNNDNALSLASTDYTTTRYIQERQKTFRTTRTITTFEQEDNDGGGREGDPLAQTFFISSTDYPNGMFLTKVDTFFATKPGASDIQAKIVCEIRPVENGIPTSYPIPGASKALRPDDVNIPANLENLTSVQSTPTTFEFDEPVFLLPGRYYAIVLKSEKSNKYNAYIAETYEFLLGSTESRVSKQPNLGVLFTSQNGFTWTPDQTKDLMFKTYRAEFASSASAIFENEGTTYEPLVNNPILTTAGDATVRVFHEGHGFIKNDYVHITNLDSDTSYGGIKGYHLNGSRQITSVDWTGYTFEADSTASTTIRTGGEGEQYLDGAISKYSGLIVSRNFMFDYYVPEIQTLIPSETNVAASIKLTEGASFANNRNTATGYSRAKASNYSTITLNDVNYNTTPKAIFSDSNEAISPLSGAKSVTMKLDLSTADTKVSPLIDLQRTTITTYENIIDKQDSAATNGFNVPIAFVNETDPTAGTHAAKHVTVPVTLAEQAVGLKILFAAHRPLTGGFRVYYKTGTSDDNFDEQNWVEVSEYSNNPADENSEIFREYEYLAGGIGGTLNSFTKFQVKIVMTSTNSSKVPVIKDLRTIALVT